MRFSFTGLNDNVVSREKSLVKHVQMPAQKRLHWSEIWVRGVAQLNKKIRMTITWFEKIYYHWITCSWSWTWERLLRSTKIHSTSAHNIHVIRTDGEYRTDTNSPVNVFAKGSHFAQIIYLWRRHIRCRRKFGGMLGFWQSQRCR